jgi:hypothetical protein
MSDIILDVIPEEENIQTSRAKQALVTFSHQAQIANKWYYAWSTLQYLFSLSNLGLSLTIAIDLSDSFLTGKERQIITGFLVGTSFLSEACKFQARASTARIIREQYFEMASQINRIIPLLTQLDNEENILPWRNMCGNIDVLLKVADNMPKGPIVNATEISDAVDKLDSISQSIGQQQIRLSGKN